MFPFSTPQVAPEIALVHVGKALDFRTALVFRALCQERLDHGACWFILDFSATGSLDTTGLSAIYAIQRQASANGGGVVLAALTRPAERAFEAVQTLGLARFETVGEAAGAVYGAGAAALYAAQLNVFGRPAPHTQLALAA